eukprot:6645669-Pyramimonas_sp.AAC.1
MLTTTTAATSMMMMMMMMMTVMMMRLIVNGGDDHDDDDDGGDDDDEADCDVGDYDGDDDDNDDDDDRDGDNDNRGNSVQQGRFVQKFPFVFLDKFGYRRGARLRSRPRWTSRIEANEIRELRCWRISYYSRGFEMDRGSDGRGLAYAGRQKPEKILYKIIVRVQNLPLRVVHWVGCLRTQGN